MLYNLIVKLTPLSPMPFKLTKLLVLYQLLFFIKMRLIAVFFFSLKHKKATILSDLDFNYKFTSHKFFYTKKCGNLDQSLCSMYYTIASKTYLNCF